MKYALIVFLMTPILLQAQLDSTKSGIDLVVYEGAFMNELSAEENFKKLLPSFERSFGTYPGTKVMSNNSSTDSLIATSKVDFVQNDVQNKEETRGAITFDIQIHSSDSSTFYSISNFIHHGNSDARYGPKNFGPITRSSEPPKITGISRKSRIKIWEEMKETIDTQIKERLSSFEHQFGLNF